MDLDKKIGKLLWELGITPQYLGGQYMACALELTVKDPKKLCMVTKVLYPEVARRYGTTWQSVDRDMRTVIQLSSRSGGLRRLEHLGSGIQSRLPSPRRMVSMLNYLLLTDPDTGAASPGADRPAHASPVGTQEPPGPY